VNHARTAHEMAELLQAYLGDLAAKGLEAFAAERPASAMESLRATG
jgi:hypothetical protein